jgi:hypothetical protein
MLPANHSIRNGPRSRQVFNYEMNFAADLLQMQPTYANENN